MSGLLGGLLAAVAVVGAVWTGGASLGLLAGGLIAAGYAASQGWIGGSVGKFLNSGWGHGLIAAVSLGSAAVSVAGDLSAVAPDATGAMGTSATSSAAMSSSAADSVAAGQSAALTNQAAATVSGNLAQNMTGAQAYVDGLQSSTDASMSAAGLPPQSVNAINAFADTQATNAGMSGTGALPGTASTDTASSLGLNNPQTAGGVAAQNTQAAAGAVNPTGSANATTSATPNVAPADAQQAGANPTGTPQTPSQMAQNGPGGLQGTTPAAAPQSGIGGLLSKAGSAIEAHPNLALVSGQALSGFAQGKAQQKTMEEEIAAQQWGNSQWQDPQQTAQLQAAAAAPITVPSGYLNRAAAVRNLMNGGTQSTGPVTGIQPSQGGQGTQPTAPAPTVAPLGLNQTSAQQPVPITGMGATPRGGVV